MLCSVSSCFISCCKKQVVDVFRFDTRLNSGSNAKMFSRRPPKQCEDDGDDDDEDDEDEKRDGDDTNDMDDIDGEDDVEKKMRYLG